MKSVSVAVSQVMGILDPKVYELKMCVSRPYC